MSNYTNENLISIAPSKVPSGTLAMKVGDDVFTAGSITIDEYGEPYVVVDDNGVLKAQKLSFNGTTPSDSGSPEALDMENVKIFETGHPEPEGGGQGGSTEFYKCASVDTVNHSWTGYKAVLNSQGYYEFEDTVTSGLNYSIITPSINKIYTEDVLVEIKDLYQGFPVNGLIFYAPLDISRNKAETEQSLSYKGTYSFTTINGISCIDLSNGTVNISDFGSIPQQFTLSMWINMKEISGWQNLFGTGIDNNLNAAIQNGNFVFWGGSYTIGGSDSLSINRWYFVCGTFEDNTLTTYIDSNSSFNGEYTKSMSASGILKIGKSSDNCNARIASVRMYNRVLTISEISSLASEFTPTNS